MSCQNQTLTPMTKLPDLGLLSSTLKARFGIAILTRSGETDEGSFIEVRPKDLDKSQGFVIRTTIGWRSIRSRLLIEDYGADLLREMSNAAERQKKDFGMWARAVTDQGAIVTLRINGGVSDPFDPVTWPREWTSLELDADRTPVMLDHADESAIGAAALSWTSGLLGMVISLIPVEEIEINEELIADGFPEGRLKRIEVNAYERSRVNRAICISTCGTSCIACGFDFLERYGEIGRDFIHVHHVVPVSKLAHNYRINPVIDLVPICPNCHAIIHRRDPPYEIDEIKRMLSNRKLG